MATSLYISNERITAVCGSAGTKGASIRRFAEAPLPEGSVINGVITNESGVVEALQSVRGVLRGAMREVRLLVGSSQVYYKRAVIPKVSSKKKLAEWMGNEFSDVDAATDADDALIYDYMPMQDLGGDKGESAFLCAARRSMIATYVELFGTQKIRLSCIDIAQAAQYKLMRLLRGAEGGTFIVLAFDGNTLDATLYVSGEYRFNNRIRLLAERGTPESTEEITRNVSSLLQFNLSERSGESVSDVYVIGGRENEEGLPASVQTAFDLPTRVLADENKVIKASGEGFDLPLYAYAVGNLIRL